MRYVYRGFANDHKDLTRFDAVEDAAQRDDGTKSPFEADFKIQQERMPETEQDAILGLQEFESSLLFLKEKKYD